MITYIVLQMLDFCFLLSNPRDSHVSLACLGLIYVVVILPNISSFGIDGNFIVI